MQLVIYLIQLEIYLIRIDIWLDIFNCPYCLLRLKLQSSEEDPEPYLEVISRRFWGGSWEALFRNSVWI